LKEQFQDTYVKVLLVFATISLVCSFFSTEDYKWLESMSIYFAVLLAALIAALADHAKDK